MRAVSWRLFKSLGRGVFSVLQRPAPPVLIFIPDNILDRGRSGFVFLTKET